MGIKKKYIIISFFVCFIAATAIGYYFYNDEGVNIETAKAVAADATVLYDTFIKDPVAAKKHYAGKIVAVSGEVEQVSANQQQQPVVLLKTDTDGAAVNCTFEGMTGNVKIGDKTIIKGICTGLGEGDAELGIPGDVYLTRCYITKQDQ